MVWAKVTYLSPQPVAPKGRCSAWIRRLMWQRPRSAEPRWKQQRKRDGKEMERALNEHPRTMRSNRVS